MAYRLIGRIGLIGLIMVCLVSCRTKYVSVPEYHTEYKVRTDSFVKRDSVWVHDSVSVWMKGDTVFKEKLKKVYNDHYIYTNKTDHGDEDGLRESAVPCREETGEMGAD